MFLNWYSILCSIKHNGGVIKKQKSKFHFLGFLQQQLLSSIISLYILKMRRFHHV